MQQLKKKIVEKLEKETEDDDDDDDDNEDNDDDDNDSDGDCDGYGEPKFIWRKAGSARRVTEPTFVSLLNGLPHFVRKCKNSWISRVGCVGDPSTRDMFSPET